VSYHGLPLLKAPVWTWEVPTYFFVGGTAGAAAVIGAVGRMAGAPPAVVRDARWIAAAGALLSPPLLISDLGRPERFLNMLRVFKLQSPMSVGAWTLVAFSTATAASVFADAVSRWSGGSVITRTVADGSAALSAATGLVLSTYTGVLLGATAIPVWSRHVRILPIQFGASSLGAAASLLELAGHRHRALHHIALGSAAVESVLGRSVAGAEARQTGARTSNGLVRAGAMLSGPVPLAVRLIAGRSHRARQVAALAAVAGSLLTRIGWLEAGRDQSHDLPANQPPPRLRRSAVALRAKAEAGGHK
jgi:formate-dependent nitrite reductase membrane component NrfD